VSQILIPFSSSASPRVSLIQCTEPGESSLLTLPSTTNSESPVLHRFRGWVGLVTCLHGWVGLVTCLHGWVRLIFCVHICVYFFFYEWPGVLQYFVASWVSLFMHCYLFIYYFYLIFYLFTYLFIIFYLLFLFIFLFIIFIYFFIFFINFFFLVEKSFLELNIPKRKSKPGKVW